ncbi:MAG: ABC transporter substrate-binding protein [Kordiimonadaceae bacterium]|nr:ABC transporter substrate-binding protein [Kordiimonadaceae bacterium]
MVYRRKRKIARRRFLQGIGVAAGAVVIGTMWNDEDTPADNMFPVTLQLGWLASNGIIGEVVADELGYFADAGLSLKIVPGGPNIDGVGSVVSAQANLGSVSSSPSLILARAAGLPIKCIAVGFQRHPFTYFSLKGNPVHTPRDLIGKTVATQGTARILLRALLAQHNIAEEDVNVTVMGGDTAALMTGQVDVVTGWSSNMNALAILGDERIEMSLWDAGFQLYANPYYVTDKILLRHRSKIEATIRVIAKGWGWVYENPEKAVEILVKRYPNLDTQIELSAVKLITDFSFNENTAQNGWGTMAPAVWQAQIDAYDRLGQFEGAPPKLEDLMTLSILEATAADRPKYGKKL